MEKNCLTKLKVKYIRYGQRTGETIDISADLEEKVLRFKEHVCLSLELKTFKLNTKSYTLSIPGKCPRLDSERTLASYCVKPLDTLQLQGYSLICCKSKQSSLHIKSCHSSQVWSITATDSTTVKAVKHRLQNLTGEHFVNIKLFKNQTEVKGKETKMIKDFGWLDWKVKVQEHSIVTPKEGIIVCITIIVFNAFL